MTGSIVTNGQAYDLKRVEAMRSAGGYAGEMTIGSLAGVGGLEVAGVPITQGLDVLQTFVPVINNSSVRGYASGIEIEATGYSDQENDHQEMPVVMQVMFRAEPLWEPRMQSVLLME